MIDVRRLQYEVDERRRVEGDQLGERRRVEGDQLGERRRIEGDQRTRCLSSDNMVR